MTLNIGLIGYGGIASRVAAAVRGMDDVELVGALVRTPGPATADPTADQTKHTISATGASGTYQFEITNNPLPDSPATSGIVVDSVITGIRTIAGASGVSV